MAQTIKLKRSATQNAVPSTSQLELGEVAINTYDGKMFIKKDDGTESIVEVGQFATVTPAGSTGDLQFNNEGTLGAATFTFVDDANSRLGIGTDTPSTALEVSGTVTATTFDGSLDFSNLTNLPDPTLTLNGDVSGSATFTNLGNATLTVTVANDSHTHDGRYYTETEADNRFVNVTGDTLTGFLTLHADPTNALHAATKEYVDTVAAASLHYHTPVRLESPIALNATYNNGTNGVGATLTNAGTNAALEIDGVATSLNDRVLVYEQSNAAHNGVYTVTTVGDGSTPWVLTRATDADSYAPSDPDSFGQGDAFYVQEGNTGAGELYVMNTEGTITFGTTAINFVQISSAQIYSAGSGLDLNGTQFSHTDTSTQASVNNSGGTVIQDITLDTFGHITAIGSKTLSTSDISEGTNLYYTDARANSAIDARVDKAFVDALNVDADTLDGQNGTYYLDWTNVTNKPDPTLTLAGDVSGSATFTNLGNATLTVTVADDSHNHTISNVDGLQTALNAKQDASTALTTSTTFGGDVSGTYNAIVVADDSHNHIISNVDGLQTALDTKYQAGDSISVANITATGYLRGPATFTIDPAAHGDDTGTVVIAGNLQVDGTTTTINSTTVTVDDKNLVLASGAANAAAADGAGITIDGASATLLYSSVGDQWQLNKALTISGNTAFHDGYHPNADKWTTARTLSLTGAVTGSASIDGSGNVSLATTATSDPTLTLAGDASGSATFTNLGNATLTVTIADDSHNHVISNVDGLQTALDGKLSTSGKAADSDLLDGLNSSQFLRSDAEDQATILNIGGEISASSAAKLQVYGFQRTGPVMIASGLTTTTSWNITNEQWITNNNGALTISSVGDSHGNKIFHDGYHPNADKWTTARTNTVTLTGDVTGTANASVDGSANWEVSIATSLADTYDNYVSWTAEDGDGTTYTVTSGDTLKFAEGTAIDVNFTADDVLTISHADTSSQASVNNSNGTIIQDVTLDTNGHVTGLASLDGDARWVNVTGDTMTGSLTLQNEEPALVFDEGQKMITTNDGQGNFNIRGGHNDAAQHVSSSAGNSGIAAVVLGSDNQDGQIVLSVGPQRAAGSTANFDWALEIERGNTGLKWLTGSDNFGGSLATSYSVFHDNYHPNADKWTTARTLSLTGAVTGSASIDGSGNVSLATTNTADPTLTLAGDASGSATFTNLGNATLTVTVADDSHNHVISNVDGLQTALDAKFDKSGGTITGNVTLSGADGENALTLSGVSPTMAFTDTTSGADDFFIHVNSNNFYILTDRGGAGGYNTWETPHPLLLEADTNIGYLFDSRIFADNYHPNADKWTTARTNTVTLTGDVTGTASASVDGSANWQVSIATSLASTYDNYVSWTAEDGDGTTYTVTSGDTLKFAEGTAIDVNFTADDVLTISHADTSSQASVNNSNGTVIQDVTLDTNGHVTGLASVNLDTRYQLLAAPNAPSITSATIVGETVEIVFAQSSSSDVDGYEIWSDGGGVSYALIGRIPEQDVSASMSFIDASFTDTGTINYRVYALRGGVYSTAATTSVSFTVPSLDVTNFTSVPDLNVFQLQYEIPESRFLDHIEIYLDTNAASGSLLRANASLLYSGANSNYTHNISAVDRDNYHQFWVECVTV